MTSTTYAQLATRIPAELMARLERLQAQTGAQKNRIVINAIAEYVDRELIALAKPA